jgi:hypothetical protein
LFPFSLSVSVPYIGATSWFCLNLEQPSDERSLLSLAVTKLRRGISA